MPLPEYAKADRTQAEVVGQTNQRLYGSPVTSSSVFLGAYQDPRAKDKDDGWTSAVVVTLATKGGGAEHIIRDPDLLAAMASQFLTASLQLRRSLGIG